MKKYSSKLGFKQSNGCLPHPSQLEDLLNEWAGCRWNRGVSWLKSGLSWALFYWVICGRHVSCHFAEAASDKIHWMELDCHWCVGGIRGTTDRWQNPSMWGCRWGINEQEELGWGRTAPPPPLIMWNCAHLHIRPRPRTLAWSDRRTLNNTEPVRKSIQPNSNTTLMGHIMPI